MAHDLTTRRKFFRYLEQGYSIAHAGQKAGISEWTAKQWKKHGKDATLSYGRPKPSATRAQLAEAGAVRSATPIVEAHLSARARQGLEDFEFFRRVYLGHVSMPWHVEAAQTVVERLASPDREFLCINVSPGTGKSTMARDLATWLTVRDRRIRGLMGSRTGFKAQRMLTPVRKNLERVTPYRPPAEMVDAGLACNAEATLAGDYGLFKPLAGGDMWAREAFTVVQPVGEESDDKEPTWTAYGLDQDFLGNRYNVMFWDDAIVPSDLKNLELLLDLYENWDSEVESRLEPGGAFFLIGQRIGANDLYRHCLDKKRPLTEEEQEAFEALPADERDEKTAALPSKYTHIVYAAHSDDKCRGIDTHRRGAAPFPEGCLLDPSRLPWRDLLEVQENNPNKYATWYQQEDGDPASMLVKTVWVEGGTDPDTGTMHPGCWDDDRDILQLPPGLVGPKVRIAAVDPSPSKWWALQDWTFTPDADSRLWLMDALARRMGGNELLDWSHERQCFTGVMEKWQARSVEMGLPIHTWVVEVNAAQRFLLQFDHVHRWMSKWGVNIIPHTTTVLKTDEELGVDMVRSWWRFGRIRLPGSRMSNMARPASLRLVNEAKHYPKAKTNDQVMCHWFVIKHAERIAADYIATHRRVEPQRRPSWVQSMPDARPLLRSVS